MPPDPETRWSMLRKLRADESTTREAWEWFTRTYEPLVEKWFARLGRDWPLLDHRRIREELLPEFWSYVWERQVDTSVDVDRRFRPFLFGCLRKFFLEFRRRDRSSSKALDPELVAPFDSRDVEAKDRELWAHAVVYRSLESVRASRPRWAQVLVLFYGLEDETGRRHPRTGGAEVGRALGYSDVHGALHDARAMLRQQIERQLMQTIEDPADLEQEIEVLRQALAADYPGLMSGPPKQGRSGHDS